MSSLDVSQGVCALVPGLRHWLENAFFTVRIVDAQSPRERDDRRVLLATEIGHATHRDILINLVDGAPSLVPAANGLPARVAFGLEDMGFAFALIAELARPAAVPAVGDNASTRLMTLAGRVARSDATVLIQGDTGTGKEGMARFLHAQSGRVSRDFIAVNCAALPETMMEAMLFGHKKGSFTGAAQASEGLFLAADGGTLFLDEIAELPLALQAKLLRALQEGEVLPVGATHSIPVNVRIIAACNRNLAAEVAAGRFREDLYWRLNVMPLELRPLAERPGDVTAIAAAMLLRSSDAAKDAFVWPTAAALEKLTAHVWPGNARELGNVLQRAVVLRDGDRIEPADLHITGAPQLRIVEQVLAPADPIRLRDVAHNSKLEAVRAALRETDGHRAAAARKLGISERTLRYRLAEMREIAA
ncbi:sigma-54-dependent Fis family transcriptional regulator [Sphingobium indicum]|uniref:Fis family transcriptional regulator n=2 Tax=Sphingobium indicum TaxID=332055 RepID=A0A1L5BQZ6_SPHIB|nr:sigma-54 dependent transcriptional regulator [Sphingobium indicum]APL95289.1 Fis family transcriptional regulator [Sphingobium indicum B90A]KEY98647.1 Fis family transcriptional regulator [Sphingomonas sp. BHC-A]NYI22384.1 two-component system response regulator FlrC [Sphingobium indicum]RYM02614.1 sigma-54-dependent Fis family transcriptional regulator [Sphingobium indicum]